MNIDGKQQALYQTLNIHLDATLHSILTEITA
jgi:hypothetical protein